MSATVATPVSSISSSPIPASTSSSSALSASKPTATSSSTSTSSASSPSSTSVTSDPPSLVKAEVEFWSALQYQILSLQQSHGHPRTHAEHLVLIRLLSPPSLSLLRELSSVTSRTHSSLSAYSFPSDMSLSECIRSIVLRNELMILSAHPMSPYEAVITLIARASGKESAVETSQPPVASPPVEPIVTPVASPPIIASSSSSHALPPPAPIATSPSSTSTTATAHVDTPMSDDSASVSSLDDDMDRIERERLLREREQQRKKDAYDGKKGNTYTHNTHTRKESKLKMKHKKMSLDETIKRPMKKSRTNSSERNMHPSSGSRK